MNDSILRIYIKIILVAICIWGILCSCSDNEEWWMEKTLEMTGTNLVELEKVMGYWGCAA